MTSFQAFVLYGIILPGVIALVGFAYKKQFREAAAMALMLSLGLLLLLGYM